MPTLVDLAAVAHAAHVEGVAQDAGQPLALDRLGRLARRRRRAQAAGLQDGGQVAEGVVAGGVEAEGLGDERAAVGVDGDGADLVPVDQLADVAVADRRPVGRAAALGLLGRCP